MGASLPSLRLAGASLTLYFIPSSFRGADHLRLSLAERAQRIATNHQVRFLVLDEVLSSDLAPG